MKRSMFLLAAVLLSCHIPADPEGSWEKAGQEGLQVGIVENPPYTSARGQSFSGTEIDFLSGFAKSNALKIRFIPGSETELFEELAHYELQLVAGGLKKNTIWGREAGLSIAYDQQHVFAAPKGENRLLFELENYIRQHPSHE